MDAEASRPVDFTRAPLVRAVLLELAPTDHVLMITQHHIISDGWSNGLIVRELAAFYDAIRQDEPVRAAAAHSPIRRLRALAAGVAQDT